MAALVILAFVLATGTMTWVATEVTSSNLVEVSESANVNLTRVIANDLLDDHSMFGSKENKGMLELLEYSARQGINQPLEWTRLDDLIRQLIVGTSVQKIKIYSKRGTTIYSTEPAQIGQEYGNEPGFLSAKSGQVYSQLIFRDTFAGLGGRLDSRTLVQTYIPINRSSSLVGDAEWVFEIYSDVSDQKVNVDKVFWKLVLFSSASMLLLLVVVVKLALILRKKTRLLSLGKRRESLAKKIRTARIDREKTSFLAIAAHELRTPLTGIVGFSELLRDRRVNESQLQEVCDWIHNQSRCMSRLLDDLLELTAIERQPDLSITKSLGDVEPSISYAIKRVMQPGIEGRIHTHIEPGLPKLLLDHSRAGQAIGNVLSNALKYSPADQPVRVEAFLDRSSEKPSVAVRVIDAGPGMLPEEVRRIFDRFWRSESAAQTPGTGLGMSIVKSIVTAHGGEIKVNSQPGEGTQITLSWPLASA